MKIHAILWNLSHTKVLSEMHIEEMPVIRIYVPESVPIPAGGWTPGMKLPEPVIIRFVPFGWANGSFRTVHFHPESIPSIEGCEEYV